MSSFVECSLCGFKYSVNTPLNVCDRCGGALLFRYDLNLIGNKVSKDILKERDDTFWKFIEFLPLKGEDSIVSLGEPYTPIIHLAKDFAFNFSNVFVKDDGRLPTATFKARGMSVAVSCLKELGVKRVVIPSAGNAAAALAAYGARGGMEVYTFMPKDVPLSTLRECAHMGANIFLVDGLISDAARLVSKFKDKYGWFDVSTNKQPYRFEGYKLMAFEIAEQFDWNPPDVIIFPTGGGEGVIGLWKGFSELVELGWIEENSIPRLVVVQSTGCAPIVKAFRNGESEVAEAWREADTIAAGLRVPKPYASYLILKAVKETNGYATAVSDEEILASMKALAKSGLFVCPEAAATYASLPHLKDEDVLDGDDKILLYLTGSGLKYLDLFKIDFKSYPVLRKDADSLP
ncbi:MAG: threonine synthase [archaeon GB-1867-035]|nr:threonine synthase [Candidatus Culexmicrobium profundum]